MRKLRYYSFFLISVFLLVQPVYAYPITGNGITTDEGTITAGVTPDSFLYGLDVAIDQLTLLLTFGNTAKARKGLEVARERLLEVKEMAEENELDAAERAQNEHANALGMVQSAVRGIERANSTEELEEEIEIEMELEEHKEEIETMRGELKVKIEVEGVMTPEQQALIDSILASLEGKAGEVEIEIENEEDETKIKIEDETGRSGEEVEIEIETKAGLTEKRKERAQDRIEDAREEIEEVREKITEENITITDVPGLEQLLGEAEDKLDRAESAFAEEKYGEAFGQATAAKQLAKNAEKLIEREEVEERELEIEVEIKEGKAKVEVEVNDVDMKFTLDTTDRDEIIAEIVSRTGLSASEVEGAIKFEIEEEEVECVTDEDCEEGKACIEGECEEVEEEVECLTDKDCGENETCVEGECEEAEEEE